MSMCACNIARIRFILILRLMEKICCRGVGVVVTDVQCELFANAVVVKVLHVECWMHPLCVTICTIN